ncbi:MAG: hypothetical protein ACNS62_08375 [Candidatus Cyclobacteriaceae bacterium M3_2C_046]
MKIRQMQKWNYFNLLFITLFLLACQTENEIDPPDEEPPVYDFPQGKIYFTYPPVQLEGIYFIEPRGRMDPPPSPHGGFHHKQLGFDVTTIPVYAMADGLVRVLGQSGVDYFTVVQFSTTLQATYGHVGRFHGKLDQVFGDLKDQALFEVNIEVKAGDTLGFVESTSALDLGLYDTALVLNHIYPIDYGYEGRFTAHLPDYYQEPIKSQLEQLSMRKDPPRLGKTDYSIPGRMVGDWFMPGNTTPYQNTFTIAYDHILSNRIQISDGFYQHSSSNDASKMYVVYVKNNRPKPENISPENGPVKWEGFAFSAYRFDPEKNSLALNDTTSMDNSPVKGTFLLQMMGPEELKVEDFPGKSADQVTGFTTAARTYIRKR